MKRLLVLALIIILGGGICFAQPVLASSDSDWQAKREKVHQLIMMRLKTELNLDDAQAQQLSQILQKHRDKKIQNKRKLQQLTGQLRDYTNQGDEKQIQATLKELNKTRDNLDRSNEEMFAEVQTLLSPQQVAQFVLIMDEIRHEVKAVRRRPPTTQTPGYRGPGPSYAPGYQYPGNQPQQPTGEVRVY